MTRADGTSADRKRGSVRVRGGSLQVRVFAGVDPVTGRDRYLSESVKGIDRAAGRQAEKALARLQAEIDGQRSAQSNVTLGYTLDERLGTVELGTAPARPSGHASARRSPIRRSRPKRPGSSTVRSPSTTTGAPSSGSS